ncbi:MAG: DNA polymerase I [Synergistaceae bacterium]|nr:DNA polymerase I [Synergistaceae bacterium]
MIHIKIFLIVDGHSLAHRAYHALHTTLTAPDGTPTGMIMAFMNMLYKVQDELLPDCTVIVFDPKGKTFRSELLNDYKANRPPLADALRIQLPILQDLLRFSGFRVVVKEGVEADDAAASIAKLARREGNEAVILSSDKDLLQILGDGIRMMRPIKNGISGAETYDCESFLKEYGFPPESMADYLAITGDKADNIQGINGIGEVGAKKILARYPKLEDIYSSLGDFAKSIRSKFEAAGRDEVIWRRDNIIILRENLFDDDENFLADCLSIKPDFDSAEELALRLGLSRVLKRIGSTKTPLPREFYSNENFRMPQAELIITDYKNELRKHPELFREAVSVWDLKTAYYLLHPDQTGSRFPEIVNTLSASDEPDKTLNDLAGSIEAEILNHEGLHDIMTGIDLPIIPVLNKMENHGVRINPEIFGNVQSELEERIDELERKLIDLTGVRINLNSSAQVSWLLFEKLGFTPTSKTKWKNSFSTDASVLEKLAAEPNGEIPSLILEYRELSKMLSGFVIPLQRSADNDGIIRTTFEPAFTGTGRLSSRDPNLQNIPAFGEWAMKIKSGLVPVNPQNVFVSADYSQVELRVLAHMSGEEKLIEAFTKNRDIHSETASWVFGAMPELVTPEMRRAAKVINFGLLYGMSSFGLAGRLGVGRQEAKDIMTRYFDALPGIQEFLDGLVEGAKEKGYARTLWGRIRPVKEIPARFAALDRALINTPIQGTAADIARKSVIDFDAVGAGELFLQVHDSLVCECSPESADDVSEKLRASMKKSGGEIKILKAETKTGHSLADV